MQKGIFNVVVFVVVAGLASVASAVPINAPQAIEVNPFINPNWGWQEDKDLVLVGLGDPSNYSAFLNDDPDVTSWGGTRYTLAWDISGLADLNAVKRIGFQVFTSGWWPLDDSGDRPAMNAVIRVRPAVGLGAGETTYALSDLAGFSSPWGSTGSALNGLDATSGEYVDFDIDLGTDDWGKVALAKDGSWDMSTYSTLKLDVELISATPEPASMALLALGGLALIRRKRRS
jgi:hypothetical protein